jgi:hypothetical protein
MQKNSFMEKQLYMTHVLKVTPFKWPLFYGLKQMDSCVLRPLPWISGGVLAIPSFVSIHEI